MADNEVPQGTTSEVNTGGMSTGGMSSGGVGTQTAPAGAYAGSSFEGSTGRMGGTDTRAGSVRGTSALERRSHQLSTPRGRTEIADAVVAKVAGLAAREVEGVHSMGRGALRALGALRERLPMGSATAFTQGVRVEVGERQAAIDLDLIMTYGVSIPDVAQAVRDNVIDRIERMTGLEVVEVNITVDDIYLGEDENDQQSRVS